jgi:hypothetical protein
MIDMKEVSRKFYKVWSYECISMLPGDPKVSPDESFLVKNFVFDRCLVFGVWYLVVRDRTGGGVSVYIVLLWIVFNVEDSVFGKGCYKLRSNDG